MSFGHIGPNPRVQKVSKIFSKFDIDGDGHLNKDEMSALVLAVNPKVSFSEDQMEAILGEVFRNYTDYINGEHGLTFDGLLQTYDDGAGDIDRDFNELGLGLDEESPNSNFKHKTNPTFNHNPVSNPDSNTNNTGEDKTFIENNISTRPRRKWVVSSSAAMRFSDFGMHFDDSWRNLIDELGLLIRKLEGKKSRGESDDVIDSEYNDLCHRQTGSFDYSSQTPNEGSSPSKTASRRNLNNVVMHGDNDSFRCQMGSFDSLQRPSREIVGHDSVSFHKGLSEVRKKIDALEMHEDAFDAHMASGRVLFNHCFYKEALVSFTRGKELKPADVRPYFLLGNTFYALGNVQEAKEAYNLALNASEDDSNKWAGILPQIHVNLGIAMEAEGLLFGASKHYKEAILKEPKHFRALKLLGSAMYGVGEYNAAKDYLLEAISLHPEYADAHCELGSVWHALGDHDEAIVEFEKALEFKMDHGEALYNLGTLYKDIGRYREAVSTYSKVLTLQPGNWRAQLNRAVSLLGVGEIDESKKAFKEAYKMTGRLELYNAMVHLQHMEKSFFRDAKKSGGHSFVGIGDNFIIVDPSHFRRANVQTAPRHWIASALEIRQFQCCTRLDQCDVTSAKKELNAISERLIGREALEKILWRLLHFLKPEAFQGAIKVINEKVLSRLDLNGSGELEVGLVFAILALVCGGSMDRRKNLAFNALVFHDGLNSRQEISKRRAGMYIQKLRAIYLPSEKARDENSGTGIEDEGNSTTSISVAFPEFVEMLDDPDRGFGILSILEKLEAGSHSQHRWHSCSVCCYRIDGPRFKETTLGFSLCALCYSSGKVPSGAKHKQFYYFKEYNSELEAFVDKFQVFRSPFGSCSEL